MFSIMEEAGGFCMKPAIEFAKAIGKTREKVNAAAQNGIILEKSPRVRFRNESEKAALCRSVVFTVEQAKRSGRLHKSGKGYVLSWKN